MERFSYKGGYGICISWDLNEDSAVVVIIKKEFWLKKMFKIKHYRVGK